MVNNLNEGKRLITTGTAGDRSYKVYKDTEWNEFVVKFYTGGVLDANADYHTDDQSDATDTGKRWLRSAVTEMFQSGKNWKWTDTSPGVAEAKFEIRGIPYRFLAQKDEFGIWNLFFSNQGPGRSSFGRTQDGNSIEVFSVVVDIIRSLLNTRGREIEELEFEADANDPARATLYRKMLRRLIPDGWDYTYEWGDHGGRYTIFPEKADVNEDWQKVNRADKTDGMSRKAVDAYRKENPGSKLKTAVTKDPKKIKPGSADDKRRDAFCARMSGAKKARASEKTKRDPNSRINLALKRWNCNESDTVTEVFQPGKNWEWDESVTDEHSAIANFEVGGTQYRFIAHGNEPVDGGPSTWWEITFANRSRPHQPYDRTGDGNSIEVFSVVVDIMRSFLSRYQDIHILEFNADEKSRRKLYERMIRRLLPTWKLTTHLGMFMVQRPDTVTEVFQPGKNWQWVEQDEDHAVAKFEVGGVPFEFSAGDDGDGLWWVSFSDVTFPEEPEYGATGKGNSIEVLSTVVDITRAFVQARRNDIETIIMTSRGKSRSNLYHKMLQRLLPSWRVESEEEDGDTFFYIRPPRNRRVAESTSTAGVYGMALNEIFDDGGETPPPDGSASTMSWIELSSAVSSAAEEMGWKVRQQGESGLMFSIHEREGDDEYRFVGIADVDGNSFEYTVGKISEGRPEIEENEVLPNSEEGIGQLLRVFQVEFDLPDEAVVEMARGIVAEDWDQETVPMKPSIGSKDGLHWKHKRNHRGMPELVLMGSKGDATDYKAIFIKYDDEGTLEFSRTGVSSRSSGSTLEFGTNNKKFGSIREVNPFVLKHGLPELSGYDLNHLIDKDNLHLKLHSWLGDLNAIAVPKNFFDTAIEKANGDPDLFSYWANISIVKKHDWLKHKNNRAILRGMFDKLQQGITEGADEEVPDDVAEMIEKIASGTSSPENKKAAIDAIVAKQKKETTVAETANPTHEEREQAMYGTTFPTSDGISWQDVRLIAGEGKLSKKTVLQALEAIRKQRR